MLSGNYAGPLSNSACLMAALVSNLTSITVVNDGFIGVVSMLKMRTKKWPDVLHKTDVETNIRGVLLIPEKCGGQRHL